MIARVIVAVSASLLLFGGPSKIQTEAPNQTTAPAMRWNLFKPDQVLWRDGPAALLPGAKMAVLDGDPSKDGVFTMRLKLPDGYRVFPHWHPKTERLTIISGTLNLGTGERFDPQATQQLPAGTYSSMPPKMAHFAWAKGETVLQLSSLGPWEVVYVNSADDPRKQNK